MEPVKKPLLFVKIVVYKIVNGTQKIKAVFHHFSGFHNKPAITARMNVNNNNPPMVRRALVSEESACTSGAEVGIVTLVKFINNGESCGSTIVPKTMSKSKERSLRRRCHV